MTALSISQRSVTGRTVLAWLLVAFGVITAVNIALIVFALRSFTGETGPKSYAAGLDYNRTLEAVAAQRALGWRVDGRMTPSPENAIEIAMLYRDGDGAALTVLDVVAEISRPASEGHDFELPLAHRGGGTYGATAAVPLAGQWHVRVRARRGDDEAYVLDYRVVVP